MPEANGDTSSVESVSARIDELVERRHEDGIESVSKAIVEVIHSANNGPLRNQPVHLKELHSEAVNALEAIGMAALLSGKDAGSKQAELPLE